MKLLLKTDGNNWWRGLLRRGAVSATHGDYLQKVRNREFLIGFYQCLIGVLLIFFWELGARTRLLDPFIASQPSKVFTTILGLLETGKLWIHIVTTVGETAIGFLLGTLGGILIAVLLWWSKWVAEILDPYIVILNSVPKVALGPVFIVWLGSGTPAIVAMALAISIIVTMMMVFNGFNEVDKDTIKLMHSFGASRGQILTKVVFPATIPTMIAALKVNLGLSLVGTIVGEFLVSKEGLGYLIVYGGQVFNMSLVMASVLILCIVAAILYYGVTIFERKVVRWKN